jgi:hypothetical protein
MARIKPFIRRMNGSILVILGIPYILVQTRKKQKTSINNPTPIGEYIS